MYDPFTSMDCTFVKYARKSRFILNYIEIYLKYFSTFSSEKVKMVSNFLFNHINSILK